MLCVVLLKLLKWNMQRVLMTLLILLLKKSFKLNEKLLEDKISDDMIC